MYIPLSQKFFFVREVEALPFKMDGDGGWRGCGDMVGGYFKPTVNIHRPGQVRLLCNHYLKGYIIINLNMFSILLLTVLPEFQGHC